MQFMKTFIVFIFRKYLSSSFLSFVIFFVKYFSHEYNFTIFIIWNAWVIVFILRSFFSKTNFWYFVRNFCKQLEIIKIITKDDKLNKKATPKKLNNKYIKKIIWKGSTIVAGVYVKNSPKLSASICIKLTKLPSETLAYKEVLNNLS